MADYPKREIAGENVDALLAAIGDPSDPEWDGVAEDATVIALLKAIATNTSA